MEGLLPLNDDYTKFTCSVPCVDNIQEGEAQGEEANKQGKNRQALRASNTLEHFLGCTVFAK